MNSPYITQNNKPSGLCTFIGQKESVDCLKVFCSAAKLQNRALDHVLITGAEGLGKETLAQAIAQEMGVCSHSISAKKLKKPGDFVGDLVDLNDGDILFFGNIQNLNTKSECYEILSSAMEYFSADLTIGKGSSANIIHLDFPHFTLIATSPTEALVGRQLLSKFEIVIRLRDYSIPELAEIITCCANSLDIVIDEDSSTLIAKACNGLPRKGIRLLKRVSDFALVYQENIINKELTEQALNLICGE